jgi:phosphocarrier protein
MSDKKTNCERHNPFVEQDFDERKLEYMRKAVVQNVYGIHARPAKLVVNTASDYNFDVYVKNGQWSSAKSIMGVMSLDAPRGTQLLLATKGGTKEESEECLKKLEDLINSKFGEN